MPSLITPPSHHSVATAVHSYPTSKTASANSDSDSFMNDQVIYPQFQTFNIYSSQSLYNASHFKYSKKIGPITTISLDLKCIKCN